MSNQEKYVMINEDEFNSHANARALLEKGMPMMVLSCFIEIRRKFRKESTTLTRIKWTSARRLSWRQFRAFVYEIVQRLVSDWRLELACVWESHLALRRTTPVVELNEHASNRIHLQEPSHGLDTEKHLLNEQIPSKTCSSIAFANAIGWLIMFTLICLTFGYNKYCNFSIETHWIRNQCELIRFTTEIYFGGIYILLFHGGHRFSVDSR